MYQNFILKETLSNYNHEIDDLRINWSEVEISKKVIEEALLILKEHLEPLNFLQFVAACNLGEGDYLDFKDKLFENDTHESLYQKILDFRKEKENLA